MALMGMHYFHGALQLGCSQGCRLIELDEWTMAWTEKLEPPLPMPRSPLSHTHVNRHHKCEHTHGPIHIHMQRECVQLQGETWQRRDQLSSRQMTLDVGGLIIFPATV